MAQMIPPCERKGCSADADGYLGFIIHAKGHPNGVPVRPIMRLTMCQQHFNEVVVSEFFPLKERLRLQAPLDRLGKAKLNFKTAQKVLVSITEGIATWGRLDSGDANIVEEG